MSLGNTFKSDGVMAGLYGGRKVLSRAFRSRFLELHVDDIPNHELSTILEQRCAIAPSYARKLVDVMQELQRRRQVRGQQYSHCAEHPAAGFCCRSRELLLQVHKAQQYKGQPLPGFCLRVTR